MIYICGNMTFTYMLLVPESHSKDNNKSMVDYVDDDADIKTRKDKGN